MKRKKSFLAGLCTLILAVTLTFGGFSGYTPVRAAETDFVLDDVKIQSNVSYGDTISVPEKTGFDVTVKAPNGGDVSVTEGSVKADQLGHYTVTYKKGDIAYSFKVFCSLDEELQLFVEKEAAVPSYVKTGDSKKLPGAYIGYYDEDGKVVRVDGTVTVTTDTGVAITPGEDFKFDRAGSTFVIYSAKVSDGSKYLSKTFEVKVQDDFSDTKAPSLTISGMPSSGNVNAAVTLPVASASDSFDERVDVVITVKGKDSSGNLTDVKKVTLDDNDYAVEELTDNEVFDNDKNMTFYPVREGDYKVVYQAVDDSGNKSAEWNYTITVSDKKAPTLTVDETKIPAKWAYGKVVKLDANDAANENVELTGEDLAVKFQFPDVYDNKDKAEDLTLAFSIKDPESKTVVNFTNINKAAGESGTKFTNTVVNKEYSFNKEMSEFSFRFDEYINAIKADESKTDYVYEGDYVITYSAEDTSGNKSTKTYTVNIAETFEDTSVVTIEFNNIDSYVLADAGEAVEFTVPAPTYSSTTDTKLTLSYDIYNGSDIETAKSLGAEFKGGEIVEVKKNGDGYVLVYEDLELELTDKIVLHATAVSDAGNTASATEEIPLIVPTDVKMFGEVDITGVEAAGHDNSVKLHELGTVVVDGISEENKKYVGVELGVKNGEGEYLSDVSAEIYSPAQSGKKVIRNISFSTNVADDYYLEIRVFDLNGNSVIRIIPVSVANVTDEPVEGTSVVNVSTADVNSKVILANDKINMDGVKTYLAAGDADKYYTCLAHKVSGGRFSLMGEEFIAMTNGKYELSDKALLISKTDVTADYDIVTTEKQAELDAYLDSLTESDKISVSDSTTVVFELQGVMPTYSALNTDVKLPVATAFTSNGNADEIVVDVKSPSGTKVNTEAVDEAGFEYKFKPTSNGTYTVTYTVKMSGKEESTFEYKIKVGDVVAPTFSLVDKNGNAASHELSVKSGYTFNFLCVTAEDDKTTAANLTYTKKVVGPDGEVVGGTISGKGTTYANRTYPTSGEFTLDASGKYTVTYTVTDEAGNVSTKEFEITVTNSTGGGGFSLAALSTILIVVGVLLIAGVVIYLFRFRRIKKD